MQERLERLEQKLAASERRLGRLQIAFVLAVVAGLGVGMVRPAVTQGKGTTVKAPFKVVDEKGKVVLRIAGRALLADGELSNTLVLHAPNGKIAFCLVSSSRLTELTVTSAKATGSVIRLKADHEGTSLRMSSPRLVLGANIQVNEGGGRLAIRGKGGRTVFQKP